MQPAGDGPAKVQIELSLSRLNSRAMFEMSRASNQPEDTHSMFRISRAPVIRNNDPAVEDVQAREPLRLLGAWGTAVCFVIALDVVVFFSWLLFHWGADDNASLIDNALFIPLSGGAALLAWRTSSHRALSIRVRRAWGILGLAFLAYWFGDIAWLYYENIAGDPPFPSGADIGYLAFYPLIVAGLLTFPLSKSSRADRLKLGLDGGVVLVGATMVIWYLVLRPIALTQDAGFLETTLSLAYPVGDLVVVFGMTNLLLRRPLEGSGPALTILLTGMTLFLIADVAFGYLSLNDSYATGDWPDALWITAQSLMAFSAYVQYLTASGRRFPLPDVSPTRALGVVLPIVVAVAFGMLIISVEDQLTEPVGGLVVGAAVIAALIVARQAISLRENAKLLAESRVLEEKLKYQTLHDPLTELPNRVLFRERVEHALRDQTQGTWLAVAFLDVDDLKTINDRMGHASGDELLVTVATRLRESIRPEDTAARLGGDEFALLLTGLANSARATAIVERVFEALHRPMSIGGKSVYCDASVGICIGQSGELTAELALRNADMAMYRAKSEGKGRYSVFREAETRDEPAIAAR